MDPQILKTTVHFYSHHLSSARLSFNLCTASSNFQSSHHHDARLTTRIHSLLGVKGHIEIFRGGHTKPYSYLIVMRTNPGSEQGYANAIEALQACLFRALDVGILTCKLLSTIPAARPLRLSMSSKRMGYTGMDGPIWVGTRVKENDWQRVFRKGDNYQFRAEDTKLMKHYPPNLEPMLSFANVKINPAIQIISSGIRHVPTDIKVLEKCAAWTPQNTDYAQERLQTMTSTDSTPLWVQGAKYYGITRLIFDDHKTGQLRADLRDGRFWFESEDLSEALQLDHYFECRFAGPLIDCITEGFSKNDRTTKDAIILLDRIVNSPFNLAWVPRSLTEYKNAYFSGEAVDVRKVRGLIHYMNAMASGFKRMIETIVDSYIEEYSRDDVLVRMLKLIYLSPFCLGGWEKIVVANGTAGRVSWII